MAACELSLELDGTMADDDLQRLRRMVLAYPEVTERLSHDAPCFFVRDRRPVCYYHDADFRGDDRAAIWCPAPPGAQDQLLARDSDRFFRPQPSAGGVFANWVGVYLDTGGTKRDTWVQIGELIDEAYRLVAPKKLVAQLDHADQENDDV